MTAAGVSPLVDALVWPAHRLGEALEALAVRSGLGHAAANPLGPPPATADEWPRWLDWAGAQVGAELQAVDATVPEVPALLRGVGPALLPVPAAAAPAPAAASAPAPGLLVLLGRRGGRLLLLGPDLRPHRCPPGAVADALCAAQAQALQPELDALLALAQVPAGQRQRTAAALRRERLATQRIGACWMLRQPATADMARQLRAAGLGHRLAAMLAVCALGYGLEIGAWALIGQAALAGRLDTGWLGAWVLALASLVPVQLAGQGLQAGLARDAGRLLKSRLMAGALRLDMDRVRAQGVGQLLGRVMESQALESLALHGGLAAVVALLELGFAAAVLAQGAAPVAQLLALALWLAVTVAAATRFAGRLRRWVLQRLALTHDLVERMVGHRTRLAQERPARRDAHEDQMLLAYLADSAAMDRAAVPLQVGLGAGWLLLSVLALAPALLGTDLGGVAGDASAAGAAMAPGTARLAVSVGGMLLAQRALAGIAAGLGALARARVAWQQVRELFLAGGSAGQAPGDGAPACVVPARVVPTGAAPTHVVPSFVVPAGAMPARPPAPGGPALLDASGLQFAHRPGDSAPLLQQVDLRLAHGDRVLLEGGSGAGKSTLAALLTGLRQPQAGLLLLDGWDRPTLGRDWHRLATSAPQFHDNHVLSATLAFNLLMGRDWPPSLADLAEAEALCHDLGLGELLARMPSGLQQRVGETGWQLSHGERSRIFLARALLQRAPLTVLDESFAALDPENLARCLRCTMDRADALVVIAHP